MVEIKVDVGVIGTGTAGLAAAISAAENGASVAAFAKNSFLGGGLNFAMGPFAVESPVQKRDMIALRKEDVFREYMDYTHWSVDGRVLRDYFWRSGDSIRWLMDMGVSFWRAARYFPEGKETWHIVQPEDGSRPGGGSSKAMVRAMVKRAEELGVKFYPSTPAKSLIAENGRVRGFFATSGAEDYGVICGATIIATGGFGDSPELLREHLGYTFEKDMFNMPLPGTQGDGLKMAWEAGALRGRMTMQRTAEYAIPFDDRRGFKGTLVFGQPNLYINLLGERVCSEEAAQNSAVASNIVDIQPERTLFSVLDDSILEHYRREGLDFPSFVFTGDATLDFEERMDELRSKYPLSVFVADSPTILAAQMGVPINAFLSTLEQYNEACRKNFDDIFCKDRRFMRPITGKRLYAIKRTLGGYATMGGIRVDRKMRVLKPDYTPLLGLYSAGNDCNELNDGTYAFNLPGNDNGFCVSSGRTAGESAAEFAGVK